MLALDFLFRVLQFVSGYEEEGGVPIAEERFVNLTQSRGKEKARYLN